jgi:hypothetical protein
LALPREQLNDAGTSVESIAKRGNCSIRKVNMTIPLAFLAPISSKPVLLRVEEVDYVCDVTFVIGHGTNKSVSVPNASSSSACRANGRAPGG